MVCCRCLFAPRVFRRLVLFLVFSASHFASAHTIPISYLTLVPAAESLHLEIVLNPFELKFFSELDRSHDGRIDAAEFAACEKEVSGRIAGALRVFSNGKLMSAVTHGITASDDSHHWVFRAHYPGDARGVRLRIESHLAELTSGAHLTQVTYRWRDQQQLASLDSASQFAEFKPFISQPKPPSAASPAEATEQLKQTASRAIVPAIILAAALLISLSLWAIWRKGRQKQPNA